ncbi:restriction endonuclease subunit S [Aliarcobacter cryaerophilus]|uniref:restriction endonuclease subunit S n=1 Tax=Aliarcobacter cryaerophilus TaxID=28198 RepID=UPI0021B5B497|nr:restriction endonuclease subunit S [Aliarcobacter cryaerophilus]MCT7481968.1 restriction endonuclease subunit S [Aliarcobacter cryaerophilus]
MAELYSLPDGWEWKTLSDIFNIERGGSPRPIKDYITYDEDGINWIKISDATKGDGKYIESTEQKIKPSGLKNTRLVVNGDFIMSNSMSFGKPYIVKTKGAIHDGWLLMREKIEKTDKDFFYYLLSSNYMYEQFSSKASGTTVKNLNIDMVKTTNIPLPPFEEQKRIVVNLDNLFTKIDKAIALHQKNIDEADIFMESVLNDVFVELNGVYQKRQLDSFDKKMSSGGTPSRKEKLYWDNGTIDWFSSGELNQLYTLPSKEKITQLGLEKTSTKLFSKGTLLIGMYDTAAMKMSILSNDGSCNQAIVGFKSDESELNILFLKYQLEYLKKDILEQRQGVRQQNLNLSKIKNIEIEYPPLKTQQKVVSYLDEISNKMEKIKNLQKKKMQSLKELKASILDKAFKGEL